MFVGLRLFLLRYNSRFRFKNGAFFEEASLHLRLWKSTDHPCFCAERTGTTQYRPRFSTPSHRSSSSLLLIFVSLPFVSLTSLPDGVPCRILQADLSEPDAAARIHTATTSAGLTVDILVNNAGVCHREDTVESSADSLLQTIAVNVASVASLSRLYGKDIKDRRKGRMLFVSSVTGATPGSPSVAVYGATKAFERSLASSLGSELEASGVGVTCLIPGAVGETSFASRSGVDDAVCFRVPGYAVTAEKVAGEGVRAMMVGYPEAFPDWINRAFVRVGVPVLPVRFANAICQFAWGPWHIDAAGRQRQQREMQQRRNTAVAPAMAVAQRTVSPPSAVLRLGDPNTTDFLLGRYLGGSVGLSR